MKTTKKLWSMVLCICLCLTMLCTMPAAATDAYADWTLTSGEVKPDGTSPEGGNYLELTADYSTNTTAAAQKNYFDVTPGKLNVLSFYYKSGVDGLAQLTMYERAEDNSSNGTYTLRLPSTGDEWKKCSYGFVPTENGVKVTLRLEAYYYYAETEKVVCYDGAKIEEATDGVMTIPAGETGYHGVIGGLAEKNDKIMVTGQIKAGADDAVKMAVQVDGVVQESAMGGKSLTDQWRDFSVSGITYLAKGTALKLVAGTSAVSLQNVKFEKDANLLPEASMEDTSKIGSVTWKKSGRIDGLANDDPGSEAVGYKTDGDCPDGSGYLYMGQGTKGYIYQDITNILPNEEAYYNQRYLFSVWYKTGTTKGQIRIIQKYKPEGAEKALEYKMPDVQLENTNGTWRRLEVVIERTPWAITNFYIQLGTFNNIQLGADEYLCFDAVSLVPLAEGKLGFYNNTTTPYDGEGAAEYSFSDTYSNVLGDAVDTLDGATEVTAVYADGSINDASANKISTKRVLLAAYTKDSNNVPQLVSVSFSTVDAEATTVQYPAATMNLENVPAGSEIRAFLWDGISGLKPLEKAITTTK